MRAARSTDSAALHQAATGRPGRPYRGPVLWKRVGTALACCTWLLLIAGCLDHMMAGHAGHHQSAVLNDLSPVFFALIIARLGAGAVEHEDRRGPLLTLAAAIIAWAAGSYLVTSGGSGAVAAQHFPSPAETLFLVAVVAIAAHLIMDVPRHPVAAVTVLDAIIVCCGTACVAGAAVLTPLHASGSATSLFIVLLYPLTDGLFLLIVTAQGVLGYRSGRRKTTLLAAGFTLLLAADTLYTRAQLRSASYTFPTVDIVLWGAAFALIAAAAATRPGPSSVLRQPELPDRFGGADARPSRVATALASPLAAAILVLRPAGTLGTYLAIPAVATLAASGLRMALALRQAQHAETARALSLRDDLTPLANRRAVLAHLDALLARGGSALAAIISLDTLRQINDTFGPDSGDRLIRLAADRLVAAVPSSAMTARTSGGEFALILPEMEHSEALRTLVVAHDALSQPAIVNGIAVTFTVTVGLTATLAEERSAIEVLHRADAAADQARRSSTPIGTWDRRSSDARFYRRELGGQLAEALIRGQIAPRYVPQVDALTQRVTGLVAVPYWDHAEYGVLPPAAFLPQARAAGVMAELTVHSWRLALANTAQWRARGLDVTVSLPCAAPELWSGVAQDPLLKLIGDTQVPANAVIVQVTEDAFSGSPDEAMAIIGELAERQVQVSVDDYGAGRSSLAYLQLLPVTELKIHPSFVARVSADPRSRMIVESAIRMGHALSLRVVAEGVDDARTSAALIALGIDTIEGPHIGQSLPGPHVEPWIRAWDTSAASTFGPLT